MTALDEDFESLKGVAETIASMGVGYAGLIGSGFVGIANLVATGDWDRASKTIDAVQNAISYQPKSEKGKQYTEAIGETVESGLSAIENVPDGRGGQIAARASAEIGIALLPFMPKMIRGVKNGVKNVKLRAEAEQAALQAKQAIIDNKKFAMPEGLYEKISKSADRQMGIEPTPVTPKPVIKPAPVVTPTPPPLPVPQAPRKSFLGDAIDSPVLRAEQQFPGSTIKLELRRMEADRAHKMSMYDPVVEEIHVASNNLPKVKRAEMQEAWLRQDKGRVKELTTEALGKPRSDKLWADYDAAIKTRFKEMKEAGIKAEELPDYLPRMVADFDKYKKFAPPDSVMRLANLEEKLRKGEITQAEFSWQLNKDITSGNTPFIKRPSTRHSKERASYRAHKDSLDAYASPAQSLSNYFNETGSAVAERNYLGMGKNIEDSIGNKVASEKAAGRIGVADYQGLKSKDPKIRAKAAKDAVDQLANYRNIHQARFSAEAQSGPNKIISKAKDIGYMGTIAQIPSSVTQFGDIVPAYMRHGPINASKALGQSILPKSIRKKQGVVEPADIGYGDIMQEMIGTPTKAKAVLDKLLKVSGFKLVDRLGKRVYINAARNKYKKWAGTPEGIKKLEKIGYKNMLERTGEWDQFLSDLKTGDVNKPNVRFALLNELAEVQPIFMSDMPIMYLRHPNGRIFYSLKTWAIRQLNRLREDVMHGDYKEALAYAGGVYIGTNSIDLAKAFIESWATGKSITQEDIKDTSVNNLFKIGMTNKWQIKKAGEGNIADAVMMQIEPPVLGFASNIIHDIRAWLKHQEDPWGNKPKYRTPGMLPLGGRMVEPLINKE